MCQFQTETLTSFTMMTLIHWPDANENKHFSLRYARMLCFFSFLPDNKKVGFMLIVYVSRRRLVTTLISMVWCFLQELVRPKNSVENDQLEKSSFQILCVQFIFFLLADGLQAFVYNDKDEVKWDTELQGLVKHYNSRRSDFWFGLHCEFW